MKISLPVCVFVATIIYIYSWDTPSDTAGIIISLLLGIALGLMLLLVLAWAGVQSWRDWKSLIIFIITLFLVSIVESEFWQVIIILVGTIVSNLLSSNPFLGIFQDD